MRRWAQFHRLLSRHQLGRRHRLDRLSLHRPLNRRRINRKHQPRRARGADYEYDTRDSEEVHEPIYQQAKVKFIKVTANKYNLKSIAYIGDNAPKRLFEIFNPNWREQWDKTFGQVMSRLFVAIGWPKDLENDQRELMMGLL